MSPSPARIAFYSVAAVCAFSAATCVAAGQWVHFWITLAMFSYLSIVYLIVFFRRTDIITIKIVCK